MKKVNLLLAFLMIGLFSCQEDDGVGIISGTIWYDVENNDLKDGIENGINGLKLKLYKAQWPNDFVLVDEFTTSHKPNTPSEDGYYIFEGLESGFLYFVQAELPDFGLVPCLNDVGSDDTIDSDFIDLRSPIVLLESNRNIVYDMGLTPEQ